MRISLPAVKRRARIEIIPLIDIVFFLLATFVMVSLSMVKNQAVPVRLPSAATSGPELRKHAVTVTVAEDGRTYLGKEGLPVDAIRARLSELKRTDPELKVFVNGDERADFGRAVELLDAVRELGIARVAIQTRGKK